MTNRRYLDILYRSPHPRHGRTRDLRQPVRAFQIARRSPSPQQQLPPPRSGRIGRRSVVLGVTGHEEGAVGGDGHHDDGDAAFLLLPEGQPDDVDGAVGQFDAGEPHDGHDGHEDGEAEEEGQGEFLAQVDADAPEEEDGEGDDEDVGREV